MIRRDFLTLLGGAAATWPVAAGAQQGERMRRIGVLMSTTEIDPLGQTLVAAFVQTLQQLGWTDSRNVRIDFRWAGGNAEKFQMLANELTDLHPDVILAASNVAVTALQQTAKNIPIVFTQVSDPIGRGLVATLARPGRNTTGFSNFEASMGGKWLETLREIAPNLSRVALVFNPATSPHIAAGYYLRAAEDAGRRLSVQVFVTSVRDRAQLEAAVEQFSREPNAGLIVLPDAFTIAQADLIVALASRLGLPAIYPYARFASVGGLLYYGINPKDQFPKAASYVDRILKGAKPADLPVQFPTKFELIINLKTAKALGLTVPDKLLVTADEVIE